MSRIGEVFKYFSKLGFIAFGGPAAHVAMMEEDLVSQKKWLSESEFLDYMGATNLIPGPNSTEMTMHCGYHRAGVKGLFVAGISFIVPAVLLTLLVAVFFEEYSKLEPVIPIVNGIKAAVISFIAAAILKLGKKAIKGPEFVFIGLAVIAFSFFGVNEIICILAAGIIYTLAKAVTQKKTVNSLFFLPLFGLLKVSYNHLLLLWIFLKVGLVLFGSGYVLFAYLDAELIDGTQWLSHPDLVEAIAIGQVTPGPVLSTATFIGYKVGGFQGALLATLGIFLPSFFYVWGLNKFITRMRSNVWLKYFISAVNVAAVAVMLVVTLKMGQSILIDWKTWTICILSFAVYFGFKGINTLYIILGGAVLGFLFSYI